MNAQYSNSVRQADNYFHVMADVKIFWLSKEKKKQRKKKKKPGGQKLSVAQMPDFSLSAIWSEHLVGLEMVQDI